jgi:hypothetical protein
MKLSSAVVFAVVSCALIVSIEARRAQVGILGSHVAQRQPSNKGGRFQQTVAKNDGGGGGGGDGGSGGGGGGDGEWSTCKTCVFVIERMKKGTNMLLPSICTELFGKEGDKAYADCHQVLNALEENGNNVRYWLFEGCYKYEEYQAKEWIKPCPSHVICSVLKSLAVKEFCPALAMEDPFKHFSENHSSATSTSL